MLTLYLLRHAKSSWKQSSLGDFERPLNNRGRRDAAAMGQHLQNIGPEPEIILLSSSKRTRETWHHVSPALPSAPEVKSLDTLYGASMRAILGEIQAHGLTASPLLVIAHNPGIEELAFQLTAKDPSGALSLFRAKYPTAGLAILNFDIQTWSQLQPRSGTLMSFTSPRSLTPQ